METEIGNNKPFSFWEHLDDLRKIIVKGLIAIVIIFIIAFCCKTYLFEIIFYPKQADFITYRFIEKIIGSDPFPISSHNLISTQLTTQFTIHLQVAFYAALILVLPYWLYLVFSYLSPALYPKERKTLRIACVFSSILFFLGVAVSYFIIFPFAYRFLLTYSVSPEVVPYITLNSYIGTFATLCLLMGILFELPVFAKLLAYFKLITANLLKHYRRHATIAIFILAAILTPTTDIFTLLLTALPILLLYEISIVIVRHTNTKC